jgi:hypothetical protein
MAMELEAGLPRRPVDNRPMQITSWTGAPSAMRTVEDVLADVLGRWAGGRRLAASRLAQRRRMNGSPTVLRDQRREAKEAEKSRCVITGVAIDSSGVSVSRMFGLSSTGEEPIGILDLGRLPLPAPLRAGPDYRLQETVDGSRRVASRLGEGGVCEGVLLPQWHGSMALWQRVMELSMEEWRCVNCVGSSSRDGASGGARGARAPPTPDEPMEPP